MIIDAHVYSLPSRLRQRNCVFPVSEHGAPTAIYRNAPVEEVELALALSAPERICESMAEAGISHSVLTALPWKSLELCIENNDHILEWTARDGRFMAVCAVQPGDDGWRDEVRRCLDAGVVGFKLNPAWQDLLLDSPNAIALADMCREAKVFLEIHVEHAFRSSTASASALCDLLRCCPGTRVLATHLGGLLGLYRLHPPVEKLLANVWFDTAASSTLRFVDFYVQAGLADRLVFGTDFPFNHCHGQSEVLSGIRALGHPAEVLGRILGNNFETLCAVRVGGG